MTWTKFSDTHYDDPRIIECGMLAETLLNRLTIYSNRHLTDGHFTLRQCDHLCNWAAESVRFPGVREVSNRTLLGLLEASALIRATNETDAYCIVDFLEHNPSRNEVLSRRKRDADRKKRGRTTAKKQAKNAAKASAGSPHGIREPSGRRPGVPSPSPTRVYERHEKSPKFEKPAQPVRATRRMTRDEIETLVAGLPEECDVGTLVDACRQKFRPANPYSDDLVDMRELAPYTPAEVRALLLSRGRRWGYVVSVVPEWRSNGMPGDKTRRAKGPDDSPFMRTAQEAMRRAVEHDAASTHDADPIHGADAAPSNVLPIADSRRETMARYDDGLLGGMPSVWCG